MSVVRQTDAALSAHEKVYRSLRQKIMHGEILPGAVLTLRGVATQYNVSMTPAREAIRRLAAEGGLTISGSGRISLSEQHSERIEELAAVRAMLEPELAARALPRAHPALIERLNTINGGISEAVAKQDSVGYIRQNLEFHRTLYLRAQAPAMLAMTETVWLQLGPTMRSLYGRLSSTTAPHQHRAILSALRAGNEPGLRLAVRTDVTLGLRLLVS